VKAGPEEARWSCRSYDATRTIARMDMIPALHLLWRRRRLVVLALLISAAVGLVVMASSRTSTVGLASADVLVDTPTSSIADLNPAGADVISARATLLANVMATDGLQATIARQAGISPEKLVIVPPASAAPSPTTLALGAQKAAAGTVPYALTLSNDPTLPIISILAQAPNARAAASLAQSASTALRQYLASIAARQNIPAAKRPVLSLLGAPKAGAELRGGRKIYGLVAGLGLFLLFVLLIVAGPRVVRAWRRAGRQEEVSYEEAGAYDQAGYEQPGLAYDDAAAYENNGTYEAYQANGGYESNGAYDTEGAYEPDGAYEPGTAYEPDGAYESDGAYGSDDDYATNGADPDADQTSRSRPFSRRRRAPALVPERVTEDPENVPEPSDTERDDG
jgi:hypothetical protein